MTTTPTPATTPGEAAVRSTPTSDDPSDNAITVRGLVRRYGRGADAFEAVRGLDLDVRRGSVTALLGTNGAGKTSTLEVVEGLARATEGEVRVLGLDPVRDRAEVRRRTGVLLQSSGFSGDLTVVETARMWHSTLSAPRPVDEALGMLDLAGRADVKVRSLSGGERRRLDLACTLMGRPELVLLDEPTTGLDPESRREVWRLVRGLRSAGATVVITTHYLDEAEALADRLEIMHAGRIVRSGTAGEIAAGHPSTITFDRLERALPDLPGGQVDPSSYGEPRTVLHTVDLQVTLTALLDWARTEGIRLDALDARTASLESVFLAIADGASTTGTPAATDLPKGA
ncbi:ABC transporter ATP-binding protein [Nocardioides sp. ChNu-153]|uniref:ABC transporter ATP-binding protein n=1 Tax=Nocardioides sp. ChNu-153 TaxID=2779364 RepID=UPI002653C50E|nr:ABC transporter ATP-binding protein [Nocardioides sp. ChNu-153]MDN7123127.1 ABC transporter ATP-binding protein [Nocardioides sp. ChNu-153]